jgi:hypothetical protein
VVLAVHGADWLPVALDKQDAFLALVRAYARSRCSTCRPTGASNSRCGGGLGGEGGGGRRQNGVQTTSTCSQPQEPKQRQRRPLRGLSPRAVLVVAEPTRAHLGVQRHQSGINWGWLANWG